MPCPAYCPSNVIQTSEQRSRDLGTIVLLLKVDPSFRSLVSGINTSPLSSRPNEQIQSICECEPAFLAYWLPRLDSAQHSRLRSNICGTACPGLDPGTTTFCDVSLFFKI